MKLIVLLLIALFPISSFATELKIVSAKIGCTDKNKDKYSYKAILVLENISDDDILLITKSSGSASNPENGDRPMEVLINYGERKINNVPIIPTAEKLGMVTLQPGEGAELYEEFSSATNIDTAVIQYHATAIYNHRFGNWVGSVVSEELKIIILDACKP